MVTLLIAIDDDSSGALNGLDYYGGHSVYIRELQRSEQSTRLMRWSQLLVTIELRRLQRSDIIASALTAARVAAPTP